MSSSLTETLVDVTMPQMGVSVAEGTVVAWRVSVGDSVAADETERIFAAKAASTRPERILRNLESKNGKKKVNTIKPRYTYRRNAKH